MANKAKVRGITIELSADASGISKALSDVNGKIKTTASELKDVDRLLKLDPKNTELLTQKTELLQKQIGQTKEKLDTLKKAQHDMDASGVDKSSSQYQALQREIISTEQELKRLEKTAGSSSASLQKISLVTGDIGDKMESAGKKMSAVSAGIVALGAGAMKAYAEVDEGADIVIQKTGATGDAANDMLDIYKDVASEIVGDFSDIGSAVGEVSTRFHLQGDELEDLSKLYLQFAKINGTDVSNSVDKTQKALSAFGLDASYAGDLLDRLTAVSQETGASVDTLSDGLVQNGTAFQELGLTIDQAAILMGQMEVSGANSETVMQGLRKALKNATEEGIPLDEALQNLQDTIMNGTGEVDGLTAAYDLFGKSGDQIYGAVKNGTLDFSALAVAVSDVSGAVEDTYTQTLDGTDAMKLAWQNLQLAFSEVGEAIGTALAPILEKVTGVIKDIAEWFRNLDDDTKQTIITIAGLVAAIGPLLVVGGKVMKGISSITGALSSMGSISMGPLGIAIAAIAALSAGGVALFDSWENAYLSASPFTQALDEITQKNDLLSQSIQTTKDKYDSDVEGSEASAAAAEVLAGKLDDLVKSYDGSAEKQAEIQLLVDELNETVPDLGLAWDSASESLNMNTEQIYAQITAMQAQAKVAALSELYTESLKEQYTAQKNYSEACETFRGVLENTGISVQDFANMQVKLAAGTWTVFDSIDFLNEHGLEATEGTINQLLDGYNAYTDAQNNLAEVTDTVAFAESELSVAMANASQAVQDSRQSLEDYASSLGLTVSEAMQTALDSARTAGVQIPEAMMEGIAAGPDAITEENAINRINALVDFSEAIKKAGISGTQVSQGFIDSWLAGSYNLPEAQAYYFSLMDFTQAINNAQESGVAVDNAFVDGLISQYGLQNIVIASDVVAQTAVPDVPEGEARAEGQSVPTAVAQGMSETTPQVQQTAEAVSDSVTSGFSGLSGEMQATGSEAGQNLDSGFGGQSGSISSTIDDIWNLYYQVLGQLLPGNAWAWGYSTGGSLYRGLNEGLAQVATVLQGVLSAITQLGYSLYRDAYDAGQWTGYGLYMGLYSWYPAITTLAWNLGVSAANAVRSALRISSPSKVMEEIGEYTGEGLVIGLRSQEGDVISAMNDLSGYLIPEGMSALNSSVQTGHIVAQQTQEASAETGAVLALLTEYLPYLAEQQNIVLDDGTLAGHMAPAMDEALGRLATRTARG